MSHAPGASVAFGVALFWASLILYGLLLRARERRLSREVGHGPA